MKGTGTLVDQLEELVTDLHGLGDRLTYTAQDLRLAQSFHAQGVVTELAESRKSLLELCGRLGEMERFISPSGDGASAPLNMPAPAPKLEDVVSLRPAGPDELRAPAAAGPADSGRTTSGNDPLDKKWEEAEARLMGLAQLVERALRAESASDAAMNLGNLALQYHRQKKYEEAEKLYQHALAFREKFFGAEHALVATGLNNLAILYRDQEKYAEAATLLRRSLTITEKTWGVDHPKVARRLCNLARLHQKQEEYAEAKPLFERVLAICETDQRAALPEVVRSLKKYVAMLQTLGHEAEAASVEARVRAIRADHAAEVRVDSGVDLEIS